MQYIRARDLQINPGPHIHAAGHAHYMPQQLLHVIYIGHRKCSGYGGLSAIHDLLLASHLSPQTRVYMLFPNPVIVQEGSIHKWIYV